MFDLRTCIFGFIRLLGLIAGSLFELIVEHGGWLGKALQAKLQDGDCRYCMKSESLSSAKLPTSRNKCLQKCCLYFNAFWLRSFPKPSVNVQIRTSATSQGAVLLRMCHHVSASYEHNAFLCSFLVFGCFGFGFGFEIARSASLPGNKKLGLGAIQSGRRKNHACDLMIAMTRMLWIYAGNQ
jgi:hypothetical protein